MNQVIEIPDSPDRLLATKHNKDRNKQPMPTKISIICNGIKRSISIPPSCNNSLLFRKTKPTIDNDRHDKGKALANAKAQKSSHKVNEHGQSEKGVLPLANIPAIVSLDGSGKSSKVENIPKNGPAFDSGKGVDVLAENNMQPCTSIKVYTRRKKLVRNECVPLLNIEESKKVAAKCQNGSVVKDVTSASGTEASDGGSSIVVIKDLDAEDKDSRRRKGKEISCHFSSEEANAESSHVSQREHIHKDPAESSTDFDVDANGWRTTHNHWKQRDNKQQKNEIIESDHKNETDIKHLVDSVKTSSCMCYQPNEDKSGINTQTESSTSRNHGKRPISYVEDSVGQPSTITTKRKQRDIKQQKIETVQRNYIKGIEIIDLDDSPISSPISSSRMGDIPHAEELGIDRQAESSTSRNRGKRPISCIEDSVGLSWATLRSKRSKNHTRPRINWNKNLSGPSTSNPVSEPENLSGPSTSNPVSEPENLSGPSTSNPVSEPENLSGPSTSNPVSEPENLSGPSTSNPVSEPENLSGPSTSNPVSEPENLSGPSTSNPVSEPENLSGPSTSNPVSEPNIQIHGNNEDLSARALQMAEDEIFAQQLQQQIYNEMLQGDMLEVEVAEGDMLRNDLLQVDREFNENDYEMLLALDEDNHRHQGATHAQIHSLPVSTVQTENSEGCLICLESPTIGDKIRHLPCLHKFHKACVDEWLSRRKSCPVCKTSVDVIG